MWTQGSFIGPLTKEMHDFAQVINETFGKEPRSFQSFSIEAALQKQDVLLKAATGHGKSLVYQALVRDGIVLVICPILGLMEAAVGCSKC